jgi:hypothetical protein
MRLLCWEAVAVTMTAVASCTAVFEPAVEGTLIGPSCTISLAHAEYRPRMPAVVCAFACLHATVTRPAPLTAATFAAAGCRLQAVCEVRGWGLAVFSAGVYASSTTGRSPSSSGATHWAVASSRGC